MGVGVLLVFPATRNAEKSGFAPVPEMSRKGTRTGISSTSTRYQERCPDGAGAVPAGVRAPLVLESVGAAGEAEAISWLPHLLLHLPNTDIQSFWEGEYNPSPQSFVFFQKHP